MAGLKSPQAFVCHDPMADAVLDPFCAQLEHLGVRVVRGPRPVPGTVLDYSPDAYQALLGEADIAMFSSRSRCTRAMLEAAPHLRAVVNPTIGVETVDVAAASELGIIVGNGATPQNYTSMAEAAVMLMLNLSYGLARTERILRDDLVRPKPSEVHARSLRGATIGIVGLGNIGRTVAELLRPFGAHLIAYSPHAPAASFPAAVAAVDLNTLMREADIVGIFVAVTAENRQLISREAIAQMKRSAFLVNVARGDAIDEPALVEALQNGAIAGAALDTFAVEPLPLDSPLRALPNVILTPHLVGQTQNMFEAIPVAALENFRRVFVDQLPMYCKNPHAEAQWRKRLNHLPPLHLPEGIRALKPAVL